MIYKGVKSVKQLCEEDVKYLTQSQFQDWKNYVIMRYMRTELDVVQSVEALQSINEATTKDEGDNDMCESSGVSAHAEAIITEEERVQIQLTRNRVSAWFGV